MAPSVSSSDADSTLKGDDLGGGELETTEAFDILGNDRRRYALHHLMSTDEPIDIGDLAQRIAAWENGVDADDVTPTERRRVYISLYQIHLPRMESVGILDYESLNDTIHLTDRGENLRVYMEVIEGNDIPWSEFYFGLSTFSAVLLAIAWAGFPPFDVAPFFVWAFLVVGLFATASAVHVYHNKQNRIGAGGDPPSGTYASRGNAER